MLSLWKPEIQQTELREPGPMNARRATCGAFGRYRVRMFFSINEMTIMKKLLCVFALILGSVGAANAQVYFDSGSARPNNLNAARRDVDRPERVRAPVRARHKLVRCGDGSRRVARQCRRHRGYARR